MPAANAIWAEDAILRFKHSDVGVAVAIEGGLFTAVVIRMAETKSLSAISAEMIEFDARARERKLLPHEYQGGSTSVSNLGMYGVRDIRRDYQPAAVDHAGGGSRPAQAGGSAERRHRLRKPR